MSVKTLSEYHGGVEKLFRITFTSTLYLGYSRLHGPH